MKVGFIGLGRMGSGMAANLLKAGHEVAVYNRTHSKTDALVAQGATRAGTIRNACDGDAVITMLADDSAVEEVTFGKDGLIQALAARAIHISCSTISIEMSRRLATAHAKTGQRYVAAPVFGRPEVAAAAKLFVVAGGVPNAVESARPLLDAIGQRTFVLSQQPEAANLVKLSGNFLIAALIESLGEAVALVSKGGIDPHAYMDFLTSTLFVAPIYSTYGGMIVDQRFTPAGFAAPLGQKDIRLALAAGEELRVPMPLMSLLRDRFLTLLAQGGATLDWSAIGHLAAQDAGARRASSG